MLERRNDFVKPYPISALDDKLGLTCADIAKSLGIRSTHVREKIEERDFIKRLKSQGFQVAPFAAPNNSNGLEFTEYALDVSAAKFFVGKWNSDLGDSYLAYLIKLDERQEEIEDFMKDDKLLQQMQMMMSLHVDHLRTKKRLTSAEKDIVVLSERVDRMNGDTGYRTVLAACREHGISLPLSIANKIGKELAQECRNSGIPIGQVSDERFGKVNSYPKDLIDFKLRTLE